MGTLRKIGIAAACVASVAISHVNAADQTTVSMDSGGQQLFNQASTLLSGGTTANGDGFVLQLGYFTAANFTGFVPLTGDTSANTAVIPNSGNETMNHTSIGDLTVEGGTNGTFFIPELDFVSGDLSSGNNLPANGVQLAIRFYNGTTVANSTFYNTVTDSLWLWKSPATPPSTVTLSLDDANLVWESIAKFGQPPGSAFHTAIPIPEPSTIASLLTGAGMLGAFVVRRRRA